LYSDIASEAVESSVTSIAPYTLIDHEIGNGTGQVWIGGKASVSLAF